MDECKLLENGRVIFEGNWDACQAYMEQQVTKDREAMAESDTICEVKHGEDYYSRVTNDERQDWYFLRINDGMD